MNYGERQTCLKCEYRPNDCACQRFILWLLKNTWEKGKKRYTEEQIIGFLKEAEAGVSAKDLCRRHGFSEASFYLWRSKYGGLEVSEVRRLKVLEIENARLKKLLAESMLEQEVTREALRKKW